jgi:hypothetical protein
MCVCVCVCRGEDTNMLYVIMWWMVGNVHRAYMDESQCFGDVGHFSWTYSGAKKYLVSHQLCKFSHLKRGGL